jgi:hypothetical protein
VLPSEQRATRAVSSTLHGVKQVKHSSAWLDVSSTSGRSHLGKFANPNVVAQSTASVVKRQYVQPNNIIRLRLRVLRYTWVTQPRLVPSCRFNCARSPPTHPHALIPHSCSLTLPLTQ